jgi:hypothetical protein
MGLKLMKISYDSQVTGSSFQSLSYSKTMFV